MKLPPASESSAPGGTLSAKNGEHPSEHGDDAGELKLNPVKVTVSYQKMGLSCNVELELDGTLLENDHERFQKNIERACQTCSQVVQNALARGNAGKGRDPTVSDPTVSEEAVGQLMTDLIGDSETEKIGDGREDGEAEEHGKAATAEKFPTRSTFAKAPAPVKPLPQEKPKPKKPVADEDAEPLVATRYLVTLGVLLLAAVGYFIFLSTPSRPSPEYFAKRALTAASAEERLEAATELFATRDVATLPLLRQLAKESKDPEIRASALSNLSGRNDGASQDLFLDGLLDIDKKVRAAALAAIRRQIPISDDELEYRVDDPPNVSDAAVRKMKQKYTLSPGKLGS